MFWFPTYLEEGCGVDKQITGWLAGLVLGGGAFGALGGGWLTARIESWAGDARLGRRLLGFGCLTAAGLMLAAIPFCSSPVIVSLCAALACLCAQMQIANWWSVVMAISGRHLGALFGLMNSMGVVGAFASPVFFGSFADYRERQGFTGRDQWDPAFWIYALVLFIGACCWLFIDPTRSAVVADPDEATD